MDYSTEQNFSCSVLFFNLKPIKLLKKVATIMLQKIAYVNATDEKKFRDAHKAVDDGNYNHPPSGLRLLTEGEFSHSGFFTYVPEYVEYRQFHPPIKVDGINVVDGTMFWLHDGTGYLITRDCWLNKVLYFKFGCAHSYVELSQQECHKRNIYHAGRCYHVSECKKCAHISAVDSSD